MSNHTSAIQLTKQSTYRLNNGTDIPVAGFGLYLTDNTVELVYLAMEAGYRHFDTAVLYKNQKETAQGIAKYLKDHPEVKREDVWFTTKIHTEGQGYEKTKETLEFIANEVKEYIGYVDLVLVHNPLTDKERRLGTYKALQEYVLDPNNSTLKIRSIGVSNYGIKHLEELFNWDGYCVKPVINQLELHPWLPQAKLRKYLIQHEILVEAYLPLTRGIKLNDPELVALSKKFKLSPADILLKWSYLQGFIVLAKTSTPSRIKENLDVLPDGKADELDHNRQLGKVDLDPEIVEALDKPDAHEVLCFDEDPTLYEG